MCSPERKYIVVCNKHELLQDVFLFWGTLTDDSEERCESGYTNDVDRCERYTLEEIKKSRASFPVANTKSGGNNSYGGLLTSRDNIIVDRDWFLNQYPKLSVVRK